MIGDYGGVDATSQAASVRDGEVTATELVEAAIARLETRNPALNAVIHPSLDRAVAAAQDPGSGPLAGVPFLTEDLRCHEAGPPFHEGRAWRRTSSTSWAA